MVGNSPHFFLGPSHKDEDWFTLRVMNRVSLKWFLLVVSVPKEILLQRKKQKTR